MTVTGDKGQLLLSLVILGLIGFISLLPIWQRIEALEYDFHSVVGAPGVADLPITIIGIDEPSFADLDVAWPWPRTVHARLIDELTAAGAALIIIDLVFAEPSRPDEDQTLAEAIGRSGRVLLAGDYEVQQRPQFDQVVRIQPLDLLIDAGAGWGFAAIRQDPDLVVRRIPSHPEALWRQVIEHYARGGGDRTKAAPFGERLVRYFGPDHSFPYFSYYQALEAGRLLPKKAIQDRLVFVGFDLRSSPEPGRGQADAFATPFLGVSGKLTPGAEIQATFVANALLDNALRPVGRSWVLGLAAFAIILGWLGNRNFRPLRSLMFVSGLGCALILGAHFLFRYQSLWLPIALPLLGLALIFLTQGALSYLSEQAQRRQIRRAFERYVAPEVVDELVRHPERLILGGIRRPLTLMFTDLANFTSLAERLPPEDIGELLFRYFTAMTRIVLRHGGTLDKFIGDALMAFWGAPLDDPDQALHACRAAEEMQVEMARLREEFRRQGLPEIQMRIGIHSGMALVGNLGAEDRFAYTAVGDDVNLASRLEGINKLYGTSILLSDATCTALDGRIPMAPVDRVIVKGRTRPVEVFIPCPDQQLRRQIQSAIAAYRQRHWDKSESDWAAIASRPEMRTLAEVYLGRIHSFRSQALPADWDAAVALEKL